MSFIPERDTETQPLSQRGEERGGDASKPIAEDDEESYGIKDFTIKEDELTSGQQIAIHAPLVAEFVGCMVQALAWNCAELGKGSSKVGEWKPLVVGLMLMVSTYSFAAVSGAHLNPAVSITVGLSNMGDWNRLAKYILCQILGCATGVLLSCMTYQKTAVEAIGPRNGFSSGSAFISEFLYTAMVCLVYLNVMLSRGNNSVKAGNQFYGLAIGFAVAAGCWAVEDISGAIFNPAMAIAIDIQNVKKGVGYGLEYSFAQVLGAFFAATVYRIMRPNEAVADHEEYLASQQSKHDGIAYPKLVAEGSGTFLVVFTFGMTTLSKTYHNERPFAAAASLAAMHYSVSDLSGGHFNPAVTLSVMLNGRGKCSVKQGIAYIASQIVCAAIAAFLYTAMRYPHNFPAIPAEASREYGVWQMSSVDMIFAFVVCYAAVATITVKGIRANLEHNYYSGLAYGFSSAAGGFALLKLLNSLANPAMTLGLALAFYISEGKGNPEALPVALSQFVGAVLASALFRFTHAAHYRRRKEGRNEEGEDAPLVDKTTEHTA